MNKILLFSLVSFLSFAQSKKEQIIILTGKIDSLKYENFNHSLKISELNNQNSELINSNSKLLQEKQSLISENDSLRNNQKKDIAEKQILINKLKVLQDSLQNIQSQQSITKKKTDWELLELKGKVKSIVTYFSEGGENDDGENSYVGRDKDLFFNEKGYLMEEKKYFQDDKKRRILENREVNIYDSKDNLIEKRFFIDGGIVKTFYKYNENGNLIEQKMYHSNGNEVSVFDLKGNLIEKRFYDASGKIINKEVSVLDSKGNLTEKRYYDETGKLDNKEINIYDNKGNVIEVNWNISEDYKVLKKYKIEYYNP